VAEAAGIERPYAGNAKEHLGQPPVASGSGWHPARSLRAAAQGRAPHVQPWAVQRRDSTTVPVRHLQAPGLVGEQVGCQSQVEAWASRALRPRRVRLQKMPRPVLRRRRAPGGWWLATTIPERLATETVAFEQVSGPPGWWRLKGMAHQLAEGSQQRQRGAPQRIVSAARLQCTTGSAQARSDGMGSSSSQAWSRAGVSKLALQQLAKRAAAGREPGRPLSRPALGLASTAAAGGDGGGAIAPADRERPTADARRASTVLLQGLSSPSRGTAEGQAGSDRQGIRRRRRRASDHPTHQRSAADSQHERRPCSNIQRQSVFLPLWISSVSWVLLFAALACLGGLFLWIAAIRLVLG